MAYEFLGNQDAKGCASLTFSQVIETTRDNFPDPRFRPEIFASSPHYKVYGIGTGGSVVRPTKHYLWATADGVGTKPELAERMYTETHDPSYFENLAFDAFAMVDGDEARFGRFLLGIVQIVDFNKAHAEVAGALARGAKRACDAGRFALINGETAELGYRASGYGPVRVNWNAVGVSLTIPNKLIVRKKMKPGQPIVGFRETSIRSNGLTQARDILEAGYLWGLGYSSKNEYAVYHLSALNHKFVKQNPEYAICVMDRLMGHDFLEQVLPPWHKKYPAVVRSLLIPSTLYGPLLYEAQGGVDSEPIVKISGAAHITGGGVPEKVMRMLQQTRLGADIETVFPDPDGVEKLLSLVKRFPEFIRNRFGDDKTACQQWNRGFGFIAVTETLDDAKRLTDLASFMGYEAAVCGHIIEEPVIRFRGHSWNY